MSKRSRHRMRDRRQVGQWLGPRLELLHGRMHESPASRAAVERALRSAGHGGLVLLRVYEILHAKHLESRAYRRDAPVHIMTEGHRRYWRELLALESLWVTTALGDLLTSDHALVREATIVALGK